MNIKKINSVAEKGRPRIPPHTTPSLGSCTGGDPTFLSLRVNQRENKCWLLQGLPQPAARAASCPRKGACGVGRSPSLAGVVAQTWLFAQVAKCPRCGLSLLLGAGGAPAQWGEAKPHV